MWFLIFALVCCEVSSELQQDLSDVNFSSTASQRRIVPDNSSITSVIFNQTFSKITQFKTK